MSSTHQQVCSGESVWLEAGRKWEEIKGKTTEDLYNAMHNAMLDTGIVTRPFASPLNKFVPTCFHILLGFTCKTPFTGQLNIGGTDYGIPVEFVLGTLVPALTLADGNTYAIPVPEYHDIRLVGAPSDGVYAVGVRLSKAALSALAMRPNNAGGKVAFAVGCATLPSDVFIHIPALA